MTVDSNAPEHRRILLLYLKTGGGHMAAAQAVEEQINATCPEVATVALDGIADQSILQRSIIESGYRMTGIRYPVFWPGMYEITKLAPVQDALTPLMGLFSDRHIKTAIVELQISQIVVFHYLLIRPVRRVLRRLGWKIPVTVVVTDPFSAHPMWFHRNGFHTIVFSERARRTALRSGFLSPRKVEIHPPILNHRFQKHAHAASRSFLAERIGLDPERPMVLVAAGGDGLPGGERIIRAICREPHDATVCVVCGRDVLLERAASRIAESYGPRRIAVLGFVDCMFELMSLASVVVTKAGPAMIMEALLLRKPLIVSSYVYGQERGNVDFVTRNRLGYYETDPRRLAGLVSMLLEDPDSREALKRRIDAVEPENGTDAIVDRILARSIGDGRKKLDHVTGVDRAFH